MVALSEQEFQVLAEQMRLRVKTSASSRALRKVLMDGMPIESAAAIERIHESHVEALLQSAAKCVARAKLLSSVSIPESD